MGKRPAEVDLFVGNMGSIQREDSAYYAKRRIANHGNRTRTNSSESSERTKTPVRHWPITSREKEFGRIYLRFRRTPLPGWMDRPYRRQKRALGNGLRQCCNPCTVRDIKRRTFDECISRNPGSKRNAP